MCLNLGDVVLRLADMHSSPAILETLGKVLKLYVSLATRGIRIVDLVRSSLPDRGKFNALHLVTLYGLRRLGSCAYRLDDHSTCCQGSREMGLEVSLDIDFHRGGEPIRISESKGAIVRFVWLHRLDSRGVKLINGLCDCREDAVLAIIDE